MSHLSGNCVCGREVHFPKNSGKGATWKCRQCGRTLFISDHGRPLHRRRSKPPPQQKAACGAVAALPSQAADDVPWAGLLTAAALVAVLILLVLGWCF